MKASENTPETILTLMLKLSIFYLLCIAFLNAPRERGQTVHFQGQKPSAPTKQQKVQQIYTSQIGIREKGTNSGPAVEQYLRYVDLPKGNPWCAAFVCWVYGRAGVGNPRTGWSPGLFRGDNVIWEKAESGFARRSVSEGGKAEMHNYPKRLVTLTRSTYPTSLATFNRQQVIPRAGDVFGIYFPEKKRIAHVGFIDQWDENWLITVEGNTNSSGDREGDGVYRKRRPIRSIYRVARYIN